MLLSSVGRLGVGRAAILVKEVHKKYIEHVTNLTENILWSVLSHINEKHN